MGLESSVTWPSDLDPTWPLDTDTRRQGAEHIRHTKTALVNATKKINGTALSGVSVFGSLHPVGSLYIGQPTQFSNPGDDIGGTWGYAGRILLDQSPDSLNGVTPPAVGAGVPALTQLWVWFRTA